MAADAFYLGFSNHPISYTLTPPNERQRARAAAMRHEAGVAARPAGSLASPPRHKAPPYSEPRARLERAEAEVRADRAWLISNSMSLTALALAAPITEADRHAWRAARDPSARFSQATLRNLARAQIGKRPVSVRAAAGATPAEILLYDEIGYWGVTAKDFVQALAQAGDGPLTLRINSPGGDVFDGYAIYNALKSRAAPVAVVVDGIAASAASFIAMAGATVSMAEASMLMIHSANGLCMGDRRDMSDMAAVMAKIDGQIAAIYAARTGGDPGAIAAAMDAETWYTSTDAKSAGLCDAVLPAAPPINPANYVAMPARATRDRMAPQAGAFHDLDAGAQQRLHAMSERLRALEAETRRDDLAGRR